MLRHVRALLARLAGQGVPVGQGQPAEPSQAAPAPSAHAHAAAPAAHPLAAPPAIPADASPSASTPAPAAPGSREDLARAQKLLAAGKVTRAIALLEARLRLQPDAEVAAMLGDLRAIHRASKRLQRHPDDPQAHFELGRALFAQEQGPQALAHLDAACRRRPDWLEAHLLRAYELHWEERWQEAEAAYQAVLSLDPTHTLARRGLLAVRVCQSPAALILPHELPGEPASVYPHPPGHGGLPG
jgi:tetratricopeptide (TPR) repeat protein